MAYSADKKPGELTALTSLATDDVFVVGDTSDASEVAKGITKANLITDLGASFEAKKGADDNYVTDAEKIVIGNTSGTNTGDNAVNSNYSGLVTNATHTGEVTGSGALTVDKTAITGKTAVTAVGTDYVLISDTSDTGNLKKALVSDFGTGSVEGTAILSTGEVGGTKFLREDGDGTCSWQTPAGTGNVSKVGTPVDNQIGVWTGDGTIEGDAGFTFDGGLNITVADAENKVGLTITQNDNTNNPNEVTIINTTADTVGVVIETHQDSPSPASGDSVVAFALYGENNSSEKIKYGGINTVIIDPTTDSEDSRTILTVQRGGYNSTMLQVGGSDNSTPVNGIVVGDSGGAAILQSYGNQDLTLQTGNATTGNITIVDGAAGAIQINPNGAGLFDVNATMDISGNIELGHASDTTIARVSAGVIAVEGKNVALNGTSETLTTGTIELGAASDTTIARASAGKISVEGVEVLTVAGGTMTGSITLGENTSIALDPAGSADGKYSGITVTGTGGATIAFGDLVTLDKDDSRWELVDISVAAAATGDARGVLGMAVTSSSDGGALTVLLNGIIRADANFPALTIGAPVYASTTGDVVVTQPTTTDYVIRQVGYALTADELYFNPTGTWVTHT